MTPEEAIKHFEEDLKHIRQHLKDKDKAPEFYEDMKRWEKAEEMAIEALRQKADFKRAFEQAAVAPIKPEENVARIEKDIDLLEFKIKRLEETIEHMLRGVRVEMKEATGHGLTEEEFLFLRDQLNSIRDDLYGEENVHFPLTEENETPVATSGIENAIRDKLWKDKPEETNE